MIRPDHGGRTRSISSTVGIPKALGSRKRKRMQKVSQKDLEDMQGQIRDNVMAHVMPEIEQLRADIETLRKLSSGVSGHVTVDRFDEIEECELMHIHYGTEVKVGKGVIFPLHGVPMEPGYMKIQVDTVYPGWEGLPVPKPTDEVKILGDATKDARYLQWPKNYLKVPPRISSSSESTSHQSSSSPLFYPTTSAPNCHQPVIA